MFDTDINHWLQSFDNPVVYWLLNIISLIGFVPFLLLIDLIILAGINFRYGLLIINFLGWTVIVTLLLKEAIGYPRPLEMDSTLQNFLFMPNEIVDMIRSEDYGRSGFPSGHVAFQTSIWIGLALLLKRKWLWIAGILIIILTMISRLYLAHHYLADVIAGFVVGSGMFLLVYFIVVKLELDKERKIDFRQLLFFISPVILIPFLALMPVVQLGQFMGLNFGCLAIIYLWDFPHLNPSLLKRILNILLFVIMYFLFFILYLQVKLPDNDFFLLILTILFNMVPIVLAAAIGKKFNLILFKV